MPAVLTTASTLVCPHGFPFTVPSRQRLLTVDGQPVVVRADLLGITITTCADTARCTGITSVTDGLSTRLMVGGEPVALDTAKGSTNVASWRVLLANQDKLEVP